jgi:uncharacterized protein (TIGR02466 family)
MTKEKISIMPIFASPAMVAQLDLDLEKLTEFAFQLQNKNRKGVQLSNRGGWQSESLIKEEHEEFIKLKKEISQHLQTYHSEVFQGMKFNGNVTYPLKDIWANINEKHHYNEWHTHVFSTLSGVFYIKHDGSQEQGAITFKSPYNKYIKHVHWPEGIVIQSNEVTSEVFAPTPKSNMLIIFPSWLEHKVESNLKNDSRISISFNSIIQDSHQR